MSDEIFWFEVDRRVERIRLTKNGKERHDRLSSEGKCLGCENRIKEGERVTCEMHHSCYAAAMYLVKKGRQSRKKLIQNGFMGKPTGGGRKPSELSKKLLEL